MSDHITECGNCYAEVQSVCEYVDEVERLRVEVANLRRRLRMALSLLRRPYTLLPPGTVKGQWYDQMEAALDLRRKEKP